ncbi:tetratricopeptide repeat protein [Amycolatopsis sp. cmx-11-51]|uniref:tetratricopeptide repeat protein n=1 Tax=unclassified Amycolatopsis TaxID=2618356 RepID=UPI0039E49077
MFERELAVAEAEMGGAETAFYHRLYLHLRRQAGDPTGEAFALTHMARARRQLGDPEAAIALCRDAITLGHSTPVNRSTTIADPLDVLATCLHQLGHTGEAITCSQEAATIYEDTGYPNMAAEVRQRLHDAQAQP